MKLVVSGWPGTGSSTLCYLLASELDITLIKGTDVFRTVWAKVGAGQTGEKIIELEALIQPTLGLIYDKYIDSILMDNARQNFIIESDIAAFRLGRNTEYYSIFLIANKEARRTRLGVDGRQKDIELLEKREQELQQRYKDLMGLDFLNLETIKEKYNLLLDNSQLTLEAELTAIYQDFLEKGLIDQQKFEKLKIRATEAETQFWNLGKKHYEESLKNAGKIIPGTQIIAELNAMFAKEINEFPEEVKNALIS
jgi:cytidylate kinase